MSYDITGKIALITGANRGIGKAIVAAFLEHGAAKIYAGVRDLDKAEDLVAEYGDNVVPIVIDYAHPASIQVAAHEIPDVEVVVSNAGILNRANPFSDHVIDTFKEELEINVFGLLRMAQAFAPVLKANGGGAFVQLNSVASLSSFPDSSTYCASKAASYSFTQSLRQGFAEQGTAVLSVHPGPIATDMAAKVGILDIADPASVVGEGIIRALKAGDFHLFPDTLAKEMGAAYESFAKAVVEAEPSE